MTEHPHEILIDADGKQAIIRRRVKCVYLTRKADGTWKQEPGWRIEEQRIPAGSTLDKIIKQTGANL